MLVDDARRVLQVAGKMRGGLVAGSPADERLLNTTEILSQVLLQDVEDAGDGGGRAKKIRQGTSAERIVSVHDPEMRHGRKSKAVRFDGHKMSLVTDVDSQLITAVDVLPGSAKDQTGSLELVQQSEATTGLQAEAVLGDMAYGSGENRERFAEAGIELQAKTPQRPDIGFFSKDRFDIDTDRMTCQCPAGQVTNHLMRKGFHTRQGGQPVQDLAFAFPAVGCAACPLRTSCYRPTRKGREVLLHPQEAMIQAAKAWQQSPAFDDFRKQRQGVEHRIARMAQLGVRQARYFGCHKTLFQVLMAATVANLTLVLAKGGPSATNRPLRSLQGALGDLFRAALALAAPIQSRYERSAEAPPSGAIRSRPQPLTLRVATSRPGL